MNLIFIFFHKGRKYLGKIIDFNKNISVNLFTAYFDYKMQI